VYEGGRGAACYEHYDRLERECNNACEYENNSCISTCSQWGDTECVAQCAENSNYCRTGCGEQHSLYIGRCW
jgi:hypothetical protein